MRRIIVTAAAVLLIGLPATATATATATANTPNLQTAADECRDNGGSERMCRSAEALGWGVGAGCRRAEGDAGTDGLPCDELDGRTISRARVDAYRTTFTHEALRLQRRLSEHAPLRDDQIVHTHNTFNSSSYFTTLTNQDPNHVYSITDQLDMDVRFLELDLHWVPSPHGNAATGGHWVTLCHGNSSIVPNVHVGCTWDRPLQDGLAEIRTWLDANPGEFIFLYLENQLNRSATAHTVAADLVATAFPDPLVYRPPAGTPCADMPMDATRAAMKQAGARVLVVGNCDTANGLTTPWGTLVHSRGSAWTESSGALPYDGADCAADQAHTGFRRWFGDRTWLTAMVSGSTDIDADTARRMTLCGVNIVGFDFLTPDDGKLASQVWSWSAPPADDCAAQGGDGRFTSRACTTPLPFACRTSATTWAVTAAAGTPDSGPSACAAEYPGSSFSVPVNALENARLDQANTGPGDVWLDYRRVAGEWTPEAA